MVDVGGRLRPNGNKSRASALLLVLFSALVLIWSSCRVNAAWQYFAARSIIDSHAAAAPVDQKTVEDAEARIRLALDAFPKNPDYLDLAGQLRELHAGRPGTVGAERSALLHQAADYYRQAVAVRPLWPYSWANLLGAKSRLGAADAELRLALARSAELGPWEPAGHQRNLA